MEESVIELTTLPPRTTAYLASLAILGQNHRTVAGLGNIVASLASLFRLRAIYNVHVEGRRPHTVNRLQPVAHRLEEASS